MAMHVAAETVTGGPRGSLDIYHQSTGQAMRISRVLSEHLQRMFTRQRRQDTKMYNTLTSTSQQLSGATAFGPNS